MKSRTGEYDAKKAKKLVKKQNSYSSKEATMKKGTMHRRMKSEERTTSIYLNPNHKKKSGKIYHDKSASNRVAFKNEFDDYIQASTSRKTKNLSKKQKLEGTLPFVANNSFGGYTSTGGQMFSMINSLNNSGALLNDQSSTMDKNSISVHHKPNNSVSGTVPFKGKQFSGMNTAMINYVKDLDYLMMGEGTKSGLQMDSDNMHNYSVNYTNSKVNKKKALMLTSQKSSKRRSVDRDTSKSKQKRSASDGTRILSSKGRKKEQSKSPQTHSAYYNKMIAAFNNTGKFPTKTLRKMMNKSNKYYNPGMIQKKPSKDLHPKKKTKVYYDPHHISKSSDNRHKDVKSLPLSLMNSFERNAQEKAYSKPMGQKQYKKVPNQIFYQNKGKVNVSGQHLKFQKGKSKSNMAVEEDNGYQFTKSLAFSGETTPVLSPFQQNSIRMGSKKKTKGKAGYNFVPQNYPKTSGTGMSYDHMGYPTYQAAVMQRPETNVNVYDEEMSFLSSGEQKHHSFYQDVSSSFASQTYDNPRKKSAKRDASKGYSFSDNTSKKIIMDKKTKMSKMSEIMGAKEVRKQRKDKGKRQSKSGFQHSRENSKFDDDQIVAENPNAGDNMVDFNNNRQDLIKYLHDKDINQESIDHTGSKAYEPVEEQKSVKKKINKSAYQKVVKNKVSDYKGKETKEKRKVMSYEHSPEVKLLKPSTSKHSQVKEESKGDDKGMRSNKIAEFIKQSFKDKNEPPSTNTDFYRAGKILGKGAFGRVSLALHKLSKKLVALKLLNKEILKNESSKEKVMQEVRILKRFRHPNVVKLFETFESNKHIVVVMELCAGGDLLNYVRKRRRLKEMYAKYIFKQIIEGIAHVHSKGVLHRDIKLDNILLDGKGVVKIADFGVSRIVTDINDKMTEQCGTPAYIAPEILRDNGYYGFACDLWSAGVVLYAMLYGTVPFKANNMNDLHKLIMKAKYTLKDDISEESRDLLKNLLERDPKKRFTVFDIMAHPWMQGIEESMILFNDQEQQLIRNEFTFNNADRYNRNTKNKNLESIDSERSRNTDFDLASDCFTEQRLDSCEDELLRNVSTKSVILAPFNSTKSHISSQAHSSVEEFMLDKHDVLKFDVKCRELDRQYEINNNGELDNGVYNKFVNNSIRNDDDGDKANEELISHPSTFQETDSKDDYLKQLNAVFATDKNKGERNANAFSGIETMVSNYNFKINQEIINKMRDRFGYPTSYIIQCLDDNDSNYCTTTYYLLLADQNY